MADLAVWQRTIVDEEGNVIPGAEIEVRREEDDSLATLYADRAGETPLANPLAADMSGFVRFFAQGDAYTITAVGAGSTRTWRFDPTGRLQEFDRVSEALNTADGADTLETRKQLGNFSTVADVQNSHIPAVLESIRTFGRNSPGDGPPLNLVRGSEVPGAVQSADGQWWEDVGYNTITVRIPSDFPTLQAALDHYSRLPMRNEARVVLRIEGGHQLTHGFRIQNLDFSRFLITSEDPVVAISPNFVPVSNTDLSPGVPRTNAIAFLAISAKMPEWDVVVDCTNFPLARGYTLNFGSHGVVREGKGVKNVGNGQGAGINLNVAGSSHIDAYGSVWEGAEGTGISIAMSSTANLSRTRTLNNGITGLDVSRGAHVYFFEGEASGNERGIYCRRSVLAADGATLSNNSVLDIWISHGTFAEFVSGKIEASIGRIAVNGGSYISVTGATVDGTPLSNIHLSPTGATRMNYPTGHGIVFSTSEINPTVAALIAGDTTGNTLASEVEVPAVTWETAYEVTSGGATILGGSIWGHSVGMRITIDGSVVLTDNQIVIGRDGNDIAYSMCAIPPLVAKESLKIEALNRANSARKIAWRIYRKT